MVYMNYMTEDPLDICPRRSSTPYVTHMKDSRSAPQITIAAAAFAGLLFKIVTSSQVRSLLLQIIEKALKIAS